MELMPVEVQCYSGYKADEYPVGFILDNKRFRIREIIDRWYQGGIDSEFPVSNYFKVETTCGKQCILKHDLDNDRWYLSQSWLAADDFFRSNWKIPGASS